MKPGFILHVITNKQQNNDNDIFITKKRQLEKINYRKQTIIRISN